MSEIVVHDIEWHCCGVKDVAGDIESRLARAESEQPGLDTRLLLGLGAGIVFNGQWPERKIDLAEINALRRLWPSVAARIPVPYIVGQTEVCGIPIEIDANVLVPGPETELLIRQTIELAESEGLGECTIVDLCTGSGAIATCLASRLPGVVVYATDISEAALAVARRNLARHGLIERVHLLQGDLLEPLRKMGLWEKISIFASNPPYVRTPDVEDLPVRLRKHTPRLAIDGGADGLRFHEEIVQNAWRFLRRGGYLVLETEHGQLPQVRSLVEKAGCYELVAIGRNSIDVERVLIARRTL